MPAAPAHAPRLKGGSDPNGSSSAGPTEVVDGATLLLSSLWRFENFNWNQRLSILQPGFYSLYVWFCKKGKWPRRNVQGTGIEEFEGFVQEVKVGESKEDRQTRRRRRRRRDDHCRQKKDCWSRLWSWSWRSRRIAGRWPDPRNVPDVERKSTTSSS